MCRATNCSGYSSKHCVTEQDRPANCSGHYSKYRVCGRGKVVMNWWLNSTLAFQRSLSMDMPLSYVQWLGSHNSFNNRADG